MCGCGVFACVFVFVFVEGTGEGTGEGGCPYCLFSWVLVCRYGRHRWLLPLLIGGGGGVSLLFAGLLLLLLLLLVFADLADLAATAAVAIGTVMKQSKAMQVFCDCFCSQQ